MYTNYTLKCFGRQGASADMVCTMSVGQFAVSSSRLSYAIIGLFEGRDKLRQRLYDTNFLCLGVWQLYDQRYFCRATHFDRWPRLDSPAIFCPYLPQAKRILRERFGLRGALLVEPDRARAT